MQHFLRFFILEVCLALTVVEANSGGRCSWPLVSIFQYFHSHSDLWLGNSVIVGYLCSGNVNGPQQG